MCSGSSACGKKTVSGSVITGSVSGTWSVSMDRSETARRRLSTADGFRRFYMWEGLYAPTKDERRGHKAPPTQDNRAPLHSSTDQAADFRQQGLQRGGLADIGGDLPFQV